MNIKYLKVETDIFHAYFYEIFYQHMYIDLINTFIQFKT